MHEDVTLSTIYLYVHIRVGEGRACWSLGNAYVSQGDHKQALHYSRKHLDISKEVRNSNSNSNSIQLYMPKSLALTLSLSSSDWRQKWAADSQNECGAADGSSGGQ